MIKPLLERLTNKIEPLINNAISEGLTIKDIKQSIKNILDKNE